MNIVDSSGWLEYFSNSKNASFFAPALEDADKLIVPTICIYEVFKRIMGQKGENTALVHIGDMHQGRIVDLTTSIALEAAKISADLKISMAGSIILATTRAYSAILWTQDADFKEIDGVEYIEKVA
jgi:predicted nucleic acid-binding protein